MMRSAVFFTSSAAIRSVLVFISAVFVPLVLQGCGSASTAPSLDVLAPYLDVLGSSQQAPSLDVLVLLSVVVCFAVLLVMCCLAFCIVTRRYRRQLRMLTAETETSMSALTQTSGPSNTTVTSMPAYTRSGSKRSLVRKLVRKSNRWGTGIDVAAAGSRQFFQDGFVPMRNVTDSIRAFGALPEEEICRLVDEGLRQQTWDVSAGHRVRVPAQSCTALLAFTQECSLYEDLQSACRTPGKKAEKQLSAYRDYLYHLEMATHCLPPFVGRTYRGIKVKLQAGTYRAGNRITWQQMSSSSHNVTLMADYLMVSGDTLSGTIFVVDSLYGKAIGPCSSFPEEQEILFALNSHFEVTENLTDERRKRAVLPGLDAFDISQVDVVMLQQL